MNTGENTTTKRGQYMLLVLMTIPVLVVLSATFVFYTGVGLPKGTHNKGKLIQPPQQINALTLSAADNSKVVMDGKKSRMWFFVTVHDAACSDECRQRFWINRQTRLALGKFQEHIQRIWLVTNGHLDSETEQWLKREHKDVQILYVDGAAWQQLLMASDYHPTDINQTNFFLVDPQGFVMMYYTIQNTYKDVMTDMKFLLKGEE